jgi:hypothetical protein
LVIEVGVDASKEEAPRAFLQMPISAREARREPQAIFANEPNSKQAVPVDELDLPISATGAGSWFTRLCCLPSGLPRLIGRPLFFHLV